MAQRFKPGLRQPRQHIQCEEGPVTLRDDGRGNIAVEHGFNRIVALAITRQETTTKSITDVEEPDRYEVRLATSDPNIKIVWVFDRNLEL